MCFEMAGVCTCLFVCLFNPIWQIGLFIYSTISSYLIFGIYMLLKRAYIAKPYTERLEIGKHTFMNIQVNAGTLFIERNIDSLSWWAELLHYIS